MLGVILLYVGMVLMSNGIARLAKINDASMSVMNFFVGGLGLILNLGSILIGVAQHQNALWFYGSTCGLLFAFTYLYSAINTCFHLNSYLYGWYCLFVAINTIPMGLLCFMGYGGNAMYGVIWWLWGLLWLTGFIENSLHKSLGSFVGYLSVIEGIITAWIPGFMMLTNLWPK